MSKHIPGNPTFVVENMPGAGSLISANHVYKGAKPDGLTVGKFNESLMLGQGLAPRRLAVEELFCESLLDT